MRLRKVKNSDSKLLFKWINDKKSRKYSGSPKLITWSEHKRWFSFEIDNPNTVIYMGISGSKIIGSIRFNVKNKIASISINLGPLFRGKGFGLPLIINGVKRCSKDLGVYDFEATIMSGNIASNKVFTRAGFK